MQTVCHRQAMLQSPPKKGKSAKKDVLEALVSDESEVDDSLVPTHTNGFPSHLSRKSASMRPTCKPLLQKRLRTRSRTRSRSRGTLRRHMNGAKRPSRSPRQPIKRTDMDGLCRRRTPLCSSCSRSRKKKIPRSVCSTQQSSAHLQERVVLAKLNQETLKEFVQCIRDVARGPAGCAPSGPRHCKLVSIAPAGNEPRV